MRTWNDEKRKMEKRKAETKQEESKSGKREVETVRERFEIKRMCLNPVSNDSFESGVERFLRKSQSCVCGVSVCDSCACGACFPF